MGRTATASRSLQRNLDARQQVAAGCRHAHGRVRARWQHLPLTPEALLQRKRDRLAPGLRARARPRALQARPCQNTLPRCRPAPRQDAPQTPPRPWHTMSSNTPHRGSENLNILHSLEQMSPYLPTLPVRLLHGHVWHEVRHASLLSRALAARHVCSRADACVHACWSTAARPPRSSAGARHRYHCSQPTRPAWFTASPSCQHSGARARARSPGGTLQRAARGRARLQLLHRVSERLQEGAPDREGCRGRQQR